MSHSKLDRMFDPPGPRGRRVILLTSLFALAFLVALLALVLYLFGRSGGLEPHKWEIFTAPGVLKLLAVGILATFKAAFSAGVLALAFGTLLALLRLSRRKWIRVAVGAYVEITRSLPTLLVLYFTILMLPYYGVRLPIYWQLVLALTVTNAALISELLRASLLSIPRGQIEASLSLGLTRPRAIWYILLPQGFRAAVPALVSQIIYLLKGTTLGYVISYEELLYSSRLIGEYTNFLLQSFIVTTLIYLVLNAVISQSSAWLEQRITRQGGSPVLIRKDE